MNSAMQPVEGNRWKRLGDMLQESGLITAGQLSEALAEKERQKCFLGQALVKLGYISQDELISFLVKQCKIPHINLAEYRIDPTIVRLLPNDLCLRYKLMPIDQLGRILTVCMVNPLDIEALEEARKACPDLNIKPILCTSDHFEAAARRYLVGGEGAGNRAPAEMSLASIGLSRHPAPTAKSPAKASAGLSGTDGGLSPAAAVPDNFAMLVREVLGELLNTFQGPLRGEPDSSEWLWSSTDQRSAQFSFTLDTRGVLCYVGPAVTGVMGYTPAAFQQAFLNLLTAHPGNAKLRQALTLSLSGRQGAPVEAEFSGADGTPRTLVIALIPVFSGGEQLVAIQGVARDVTRRAAAEHSLYQAATHDALTGLFNLRSFLSRLEESVLLAKRHGTPVSIAVVNIDDFTRINEVHGLQEGDAVLRQVGQILRQTLRGEDIVAYSGGDEFCMIMPHVTPESAQNALGRYRDALTGATFVSASGVTISFTVTAGFSTVAGSDLSPAQLLESARDRVRQGKESGGNSIVLSP